MKNNFLNLAALLLLTFSITGCYTVIWDPSQPQLPERNNNGVYEGYYSDPYYGDYAYYYDSPWWFDISINSIKTENTDRDGNTNISTIRNIGDGRGTATRNIWNLFTDPASRSSQSGTINKNNTGNTNTKTSTRSDDRSSGSNNVRNNNGTRSTDKDKDKGRIR